MEDIPALHRGVGLDGLQSSLPIQTIQGFYEKPQSCVLVVLEAGDLLKLLLRIDP